MILINMLEYVCDDKDSQPFALVPSYDNSIKAFTSGLTFYG